MVQAPLTFVSLKWKLTIKSRHNLNQSLLICDIEKHNELNNIPIALYY